MCMTNAALCDRLPISKCFTRRNGQRVYGQQLVQVGRLFFYTPYILSLYEMEYQQKYFRYQGSLLSCTEYRLYRKCSRMLCCIWQVLYFIMILFYSLKVCICEQVYEKRYLSKNFGILSFLDFDFWNFCWFLWFYCVHFCIHFFYTCSLNKKFMVNSSKKAHWIWWANWMKSVGNKSDGYVSIEYW